MKRVAWLAFALGCGPSAGSPGASESTSGTTQAGPSESTSGLTTTTSSSSPFDTSAANEDTNDSIVESDIGVGRPGVCADERGALEVCFTAESVLEGRFAVVSTTGDVNGDGLPDVVVWSMIDDGSREGVPELLVFPGTGTRTLGEPIASDWNAMYVAEILLVDVDGDGALDFIGNAPYLPGLWLATGNGEAGFGAVVPLGFSYDIQYLTNGDLDGDGVDELVASMGLFSTELAIVSWLDPDAPSTSWRETGLGPGGVEIGDLGVGSASVDLVVFGHNGREWRIVASDGSSEGTDPWSTLLVVDDGVQHVRIADVTSDRLDDLLLARGSSFEVHWRTGPADLAPLLQEDVPTRGNGIERLLFGEFLPGTGTNIAAMTSARVLVRDLEDFPWDYGDTPQLNGRVAATADLDQDGLTDIVAPDYGGDSLVVLWNDSRGP
jgi:hypothetical protein